MTDDSCRRRSGAFRHVWSWVLLVVVLLSAAPTGGAPRSAMIGSAFDPATFSVIVNPKAPRATAAAEVKRRKHHRTLPDSAHVPAAVVFVAASMNVAVSVPAPSSPGPIEAFHLIARSHPPRAPPGIRVAPGGGV